MNHKTIKTIFTITAVLVFLLFAAAFALSYDALLHLAMEHGITPKLAPLWPLGLDAFMAAASLAALWASLNQARRLFPHALVGLAFLASVVFNVVHAEQLLLSQVIAGLPPAVAFLAFELLMMMVRHQVARATVEATLSEATDTLAQLKAQADEANAELKATRAKKRAATKQLRAVNEQVAELKQAHAELQAAGGSAKTVRQRKLRELLESTNGDRQPQQWYADKLRVSLNTIKRDFKEIDE
jgi:hypothetical protein